jgi:hypothetical protein
MQSEGNTLDGRYARLREQAQAETPPKWDHTDGDTLTGTLLELGSYEGEYGSSVTLIIEVAGGGSTEQGEPLQDEYVCTFYASRTVAEKKVDGALKRGLKPGDLVAIQAKGTPAGKSYFDYGFAFEPGDGPAQTSIELPEPDEHARAHPDDAGTGETEQEDGSRQEERPTFDGDVPF